MYVKILSSCAILTHHYEIFMRAACIHIIAYILQHHPKETLRLLFG